MSEISRRTFVTASLAASAGAAIAADAGSAAVAGAPSKPAAPRGELPKGKIKELQLSRLMLGGNLLTHFTHSRDLRYVYELAKHYNTKEKILETFAIAESQGINTVVLQGITPFLKEYREKRGGKIQCIFGPIAPVNDGLVAYTRAVQEVVDAGVDAVYFWGVHADALVSQKKIDLIGKAVEIGKSHGVPSGVAAHNLDVVVECERNKVGADFYIKTLHHHNYPSAKLNFDSSWCSNPEETIQFMKTVEKPWIAFKVMAAGAIPPQLAFPNAYRNGADFLIAGMFDFQVEVDVKIALGAIKQASNRKRPWRA